MVFSVDKEVRVCEKGFGLNYSLTDPLPDFFGSGFSFSGRFIISVSSPTYASEPLC
ncbi:hypothetical protein RGR602_PB00208 (plasmid) [Rhizobium gallicum bv. gallicum R602sp]|uniref:Uncharacterized protein n=1 Tax=Rhizobium gallicum bv. gallicum R602sp TaxID=1041138 RepID=A0A0B4XAE0_9HYPH|nr:hypothetical protein RGR602_PB00208 [Rhizobium gallicum bv. gallicum R602sp]